MSTYDDAMDTSPDKGKGKAKDESIPVEEEEEEEDSSSEEETGDTLQEEEVGELGADDLDPIDPSNIVPDRTRGKVIDYTKVDQTNLAEDDDDDDDDDFEDKTAEEEDVDKMEH